MSTPCFNDLVLLEYGWAHQPGDGSGKTDCFQLLCEVRRRFQLRDLQDDFAWVYRTYTEATLPNRRIARWLLTAGTRTTQLQPGTINLTGPKALASWTGERWIYIAPGRMVVQCKTLPGAWFIVP